MDSGSDVGAMVDAAADLAARQSANALALLKQAAAKKGCGELIPDIAWELQTALIYARRGNGARALQWLRCYAAQSPDPLGYIPPAAHQVAAAVRHVMATIGREPMTPPQTCPEW